MTSELMKRFSASLAKEKGHTTAHPLGKLKFDKLITHSVVRM